MTHFQGAVMNVLLVGEDVALLEGLAQSFAALGYTPRVTLSVHDAREGAVADPPLLAIIDGELAVEANADALAIQLSPGGALVLYHRSAGERPLVPPGLQRAVMADLALPLERNRLIALAQRISERVRATGRSRRQTPPEQQAF
jgi:DNA-binding NtrC family response regulator